MKRFRLATITVGLSCLLGLSPSAYAADLEPDVVVAIDGLSDPIMDALVGSDQWTNLGGGTYFMGNGGAAVLIQTSTDVQGDLSRITIIMGNGEMVIVHYWVDGGWSTIQENEEQVD